MIDIIERLRKQLKRHRRPGDPSIGLEYNKIVLDRRVSLYIYSADIARAPNVVSDDFEFKDVHAEARRINCYRSFVDFKSRKVKGRF
jgi:hypothetical protein